MRCRSVRHVTQTILIAAAALVISVLAADSQIVDVPAHASKDLYFQFNLSGTVYVKIAAKLGGSPCAEFWWIKWPLGTIETLGMHCNFAAFEIPSLFGLSVSSKLRVGAAANPIRVGIADNEEVARSISLDF